MSLTKTFFDTLDGMIGAGKSVSELRAFIGPYPEQFEALERDAQPKGGKTQLQKANAEIERLESELDKLRQEVERLNFSLNQFQKAGKEKDASASDDLPPEQLDILRVLSTGLPHPLNAIVDGLHMQIEVAKFHLHELYQAKLISTHNYIGRPTTYYLVQAGRKYLMDRGELK